MFLVGEEAWVDEVFKALADPVRRTLLDRLNARNGQTLRELCEGLEIARQSVSKHLAVLESADLVTTRWRGREKLHYLNAAPVNAIADRWIGQYARERVRALSDLKMALETGMGTNEFVYKTYIRTTPEKLWQALTDPAFTGRYWGVSFESDWSEGAHVKWRFGKATMDGPEQVVLEAKPYSKLSYTWHDLNAEFAAEAGIDAETMSKLEGESRSKVTFEIEPAGDKVVMLTVIHDGFDPGSLILETVGDGWMQLLSSLKTLLETGEPLPANA